MTYKEFIRAFRKIARQERWEINEDGMIRVVTCGACPITFLHGRHWPSQFDPNDFIDAAREMGLTENGAQEIVNAADHGYGSRGKYDAHIRRDLLKACGLKERT